MLRAALGLDLGQVSDFSALCTAIERPQSGAERAAQLAEARAVGGTSVPPPECHYDVPRLVRWPLGTPYPSVVEQVARYAIDTRKRLPGALIALIIDGTGVGRGIVDMFALDPRFRRLAIVMVAVSITGGNATTLGRRDDGIDEWHVPKKELVSAAQLLLQTRRLHVASNLTEATTLTHELRHFKMKISTSANMQYESWREGDHDDLVLASALASWSLVRGPLGLASGAAAGGRRELPETRG